jgi:hypothetical protein
MSGRTALAAMGPADVIEHVPVAAIVVEAPSGRIVRANARAREMVSVSSAGRSRPI